MIRRRPISILLVSIALALMIMFELSADRNIERPAVQAVLRDEMLPMWLQYTLMVVGLAVEIVSALGIFYGKNWARWLYASGVACLIVIRLATSSIRAALLPAIIFYALVTFFIFTPEADRYFRPGRWRKRTPEV